MSDVAKKQLFVKALEICLETYKIPFVNIDHHPKVIAAVSLSMAAKFRHKNGLEIGFSEEIGGHKWFKLVDSGLLESDLMYALKEIESFN